MPDAPCPAAILGLNGLYDLPALVHGLDASHEHLRGEYEQLLSRAFGADQRKWTRASPALFDPEIAERVHGCKAPRLVVVDQSPQDQLVPMNQKERLEAALGNVSGLRTIAGHRRTGLQAAPWELGSMLWESVQDVFALTQRPTTRSQPSVWPI